MLFLKGIGALIVTLALFSLFSLKCPKGDKAMGGLANAAVASFLVEAICKYILGDFAGISFFNAVGNAAGSLGGPAAAVLVGLAMGTDPVLAVSSALALKGFGILPGFIVGYLIHWALKPVIKYIPEGVNTIAGALLAASLGYGIAYVVDPTVTLVIGLVGDALIAATEQSPVFMGLLLGGIIKIVCTSPLSSMALTAMLQLTGVPMGIACISCFGGTFTNGVIFRMLKLGNDSQTVAVMLEPLTQADIITKNPIPIYGSNFFGGAISGVFAAWLGIVCDAPGTAAPIPGMLAPFAFNASGTVLLALGLSAVGGSVMGVLTGWFFRWMNKKEIYLYPAAKEEAEKTYANS